MLFGADVYCWLLLFFIAACPCCYCLLHFVAAFNALYLLLFKCFVSAICAIWCCSLLLCDSVCWYCLLLIVVCDSCLLLLFRYCCLEDGSRILLGLINTRCFINITYVSVVPQFATLIKILQNEHLALNYTCGINCFITQKNKIVVYYL